jgi:putative SOS response-associated peptidase YedK
MCGRYTITTPLESLRNLFDFEGNFNLGARYNVAPTQNAAVVRNAPDGGGRELVMLRWGLVPRWAKELSIGSRMINARTETVASKPSFREAYKKRRCLIPADGYFEWKKKGEIKQPYLLRRRDDAPMAFAGLWENWKVPEANAEAAGQPTGTEITTFTILTTDANETAKPTHHRMPLILEPEFFEAWLTADDPSDTDVMLAVPAVALSSVAVNRRVGSPRNDDPACIEPI